MDNRSAPKDTQALARIEAVGAKVLFLPLDSPDFNPIEKMWSKVKSILRKIKARTHETLIHAIATALEAITAQDAQGWFESCVYACGKY